MADVAGELYFLGEVDPLTGEPSPFVKIGLVREHEDRGTAQRLKEHQTGNPRQIAELHVVGTPRVETVETTMHGLYAPHRVGGEWFRLEGGLLDDAVQRARTLANDLTTVVPILDEAVELSRALSAGPKVASTPELDELVRHLAAAKLIKQLIGTAEKVVGRTLDELGSRRGGLDRFVTVQEKQGKAKLDEDRLAADHPELHARFLVTTQKLVQRFTPVTAKKLGIDVAHLPGDVTELVNEIGSTAERVSADREDPTTLHRLYLSVLQVVAPVKLDLAVLEARLKVACGTAPGVEDVCTWNRVMADSTTFDRKAFEDEYPELSSAYQTAESTQRSIVVARDLGYRL